MGMFSNNARHGHGLLITSDGTYCETSFSNGEIGVSCHLGLIVSICVFLVKHLHFSCNSLPFVMTLLN